MRTSCIREVLVEQQWHKLRQMYEQEVIKVWRFQHDEGGVRLIRNVVTYQPDVARHYVSVDANHQANFQNNSHANFAAKCKCLPPSSHPKLLSFIQFICAGKITLKPSICPGSSFFILLP